MPLISVQQKILFYPKNPVYENKKQISTKSVTTLIRHTYPAGSDKSHICQKKKHKTKLINELIERIDSKK